MLICASENACFRQQNSIASTTTVKKTLLHGSLSHLRLLYCSLLGIVTVYISSNNLSCMPTASVEHWGPKRHNCREDNTSGRLCPLFVVVVVVVVSFRSPPPPHTLCSLSCSQYSVCQCNIELLSLLFLSFLSVSLWEAPSFTIHFLAVLYVRHPLHYGMPGLLGCVFTLRYARTTGLCVREHTCTCAYLRASEAMLFNERSELWTHDWVLRDV